MKHSCLVALGIFALAASPAVAQQILYQENFDSAALSSTSAGPGSYVAVDTGTAGWQVQGGCGGGTITLTAGINNLGMSGSQALFGTWDFSAASSYTWNQYTYYGVPGAGAGVTLADIMISLDLFMDGSSSTTPIAVSALQGSGSNTRDYTPTLVNGAYTHVQFTLDQTTATGAAFDPTQPFWFRVSHGNGGFDFDTPNTVQIDNVMITVVPEPATAVLLAFGAFGLMFLRRRRS